MDVPAGETHTGAGLQRPEDRRTPGIVVVQRGDPDESNVFWSNCTSEQYHKKKKNRLNIFSLTVNKWQSKTRYSHYIDSWIILQELKKEKTAIEMFVLDAGPVVGSHLQEAADGHAKPDASTITQQNVQNHLVPPAFGKVRQQMHEEELSQSTERVSVEGHKNTPR